MDIRVGHGYDIHRLAEVADGGRNELVLGGVTLDCTLGAISHSDGDAVLHAVSDAILSAIGEPDIGTLFPNSDPSHKDRDSKDFLLEAVHRANTGGWVICNIDITVLCDEPKIGPYRDQICDSIHSLTASPVNIKGKTHEDTLRSGAIEVHVVALVQRGKQ
ncbi:MAG: 2-C-methyl-D-erythritol 2,4-cyclodiphosphate synthase [Planctomycetes bacterium]|nr:2-C-methyl-D-erythritol 2,4-cyclodiphosphate synthase [Planctomycetota bacterium]